MSLSGEVYLFQKLAHITSGIFAVPEDPQQVHHFFSQHISPPINSDPIVLVKREDGSTVTHREICEMGFPVQKEDLIQMALVIYLI